MSGADLKSVLKQLDDYLESELEKPNFNCYVIKQDGDSQRPLTRASRNLVVNDSGDKFLRELNDLPLKNNTPSFDGDTSPCNGRLIPSCSTSVSGNTDGMTIPDVYTKKCKAVDIIDPMSSEKIN